MLRAAQDSHRFHLAWVPGHQLECTGTAVLGSLPVCVWKCFLAWGLSHLLAVTINVPHPNFSLRVEATLTLFRGIISPPIALQHKCNLSLMQVIVSPQCYGHALGYRQGSRTTGEWLSLGMASWGCYWRGFSCGSKHSLSDICARTHTHTEPCLHPFPHPWLYSEETSDNAGTSSSETPPCQRKCLLGKGVCQQGEQRHKSELELSQTISRCVHGLLWDSSGHLPQAVLAWKLFQQNRAAGILSASPAGFYFWGVAPEGWSWDFCFWIKSTLGIWKPSHIQSLPGMWRTSHLRHQLFPQITSIAIQPGQSL